MSPRTTQSRIRQALPGALLVAGSVLFVYTQGDFQCLPEKCPAEFLSEKGDVDLQVRALRTLRDGPELQETLYPVAHLAGPYDASPEIVRLAGEVLAAHGEYEELRSAFRLHKPQSLDPRISPEAVALWPSVLEACVQLDDCKVGVGEWGHTWVTWPDGTISSPVQWAVASSGDDTVQARWAK